MQQRKQIHIAMADAVAMLACPVCHAALAAFGEQEIDCSGCGRRYPVRDGLPILLASAALE